MTTTSNTLERRYRKLLRAYPQRYRTERGDEIVGTYLEMASQGKTRPSFADTFDVLRGAIRPRLRAERPNMAAGLQLAAVLALATAASLSALWLLRIEVEPLHSSSGVHGVGPFQSFGALAWFAWLATALAAAFLPGRWVRKCVAASIGLTVAVNPLAWVLGLDMPAWDQFAAPPPYVLAPHVVLGAVALAFPLTTTPLLRFVPLIAAISTAVIIATTFPGPDNPQLFAPYTYDIEETLTRVGICMLAVGVPALATDVAVRRRTQGLWATMIMALPAAALAVTAPSRHVPHLDLRQNQWLYQYDRLELTVADLAMATISLACLITAVYLRRLIDQRTPES